MLAAVGQQGDQHGQAPKVHDLLAELVADGQAGQGTAQLAQDARVVRERWGAQGHSLLKQLSPGGELEGWSTLARGKTPGTTGGCQEAWGPAPHRGVSRELD